MSETTTAAIRIEDGTPWIGDRSFPWAAAVDNKDLEGWHKRRFRLAFENGWTLSVVFGSGTYSTNHDAFSGREEFTEEASTAEIALWDQQDRWVKWDDGGDTVRGWCSGEFVLAVIDFAAALPSDGFDFDAPVSLP